jgi:carboxyl-terminal processing protease
MQYKRVFYFYLIFIFGVAVAFGCGYFLHMIQDQKAATPQFPLLAQAYEILENHAYDDLPMEPELEYGMIHGMVGAYDDPYTRFVEPVQHELASDNLAGKFGGIGANLEQDPDGFVILHPFSDSPASIAGIKDGDRLVRVDDLVITPDIPMDEIVASMRGPEGESVDIEIIRPPDFTSKIFTINRVDFPIPSVTWHLAPAENRLGIIQVNLIAASTPDEIKTAIPELQDRGATHFVLDLRDNRGGLLTTGVDIARLFLTPGIVIEEQYRGQEINPYQVKKVGDFADLPIVVLINENTASAAEIIAGAIQARDRAPLIGTPSFGKDSIQLVFDLADESSLHVTAAKWWVPGLSTPIGEGGLQPNIGLNIDGVEGDPAISTAIVLFFE